MPSAPASLPGLAAAASGAAIAHVGACSRWLFESEELEVDDWPPSPAVGPFDGCDTCTVREALAAALPVVRDAVVAYLRLLPDVDALTAAGWLERDWRELALPEPCPVD